MVSQIPNGYNRHSTRLKGYDYASPGTYFVTACAYERECVFGEIWAGTMTLNQLGVVVESEWVKSASLRSEIQSDFFQIMPNHIHAVVHIQKGRVVNQDMNPVGANGRSPLQMRPRSLSSLMAGFKSSVTTRINRLRNTPGLAVWQRGFYDRIVRDTADLNRIREYIENNPAKWQEDQENPTNWI
jgi:REP element-mobilizing transposase RayT